MSEARQERWFEVSRWEPAEFCPLRPALPWTFPLDYVPYGWCRVSYEDDGLPIIHVPNGADQFALEKLQTLV